MISLECDMKEALESGLDTRFLELSVAGGLCKVTQPARQAPAPRPPPTETEGEPNQENTRVEEGGDANISPCPSNRKITHR